MSRPTTLSSSRSSSRSVGRPRGMPCSRTGNASNSSERSDFTPETWCPNAKARKRSTGETLVADKRNKAARNRVDDGRPFRAADDHLQLLHASLADGNHEATPRLELLVQSRWHVWSRGSDRNRRERSTLGQAERSVADVDADVLVTGGCEIRARLACKLGDSFDRVDLVRKLREHCGLVPRARA